MKHSKKKKRPPNKSGAKGAARGKENEESKVLNSLVEAFTSVSLDDAASAYREAKGDPNKAAEILEGLPESVDDQATVCSSSSGSSRLSSSSSSSGSSRLSSSSQEGFMEDNCGRDATVCSSSSGSSRLSSSSSSSGSSRLSSSSQEGFMEDNCGRDGSHGRGFRGPKQKKVVATTGTVSTVLGKDYVMSSSRKDSSKSKGYTNEPVSKEEAEQFLCSMLGKDCKLSMAVVRDVLCQCGYDVERAMNALLELCASSYVESKNGQSCELSANDKEDTEFFFECSDSVITRSTDTISHTSESEIQDIILSINYRCRNYAEVVTGSEVHSQIDVRNSKSELSQEVLKFLFNTPSSSKHEPSRMKWRDIMKKIESLGNRFDCVPGDVAQTRHIHAKGDEYQVSREPARQHWDSMKSYNQKAATAFSNGERGYAAYLSDQRRLCKKKAREADKKASQDIFKARNKSIENVMTIDLHGQHIKEALRLLKVHLLLYGAYVRSVQHLRVITGCGSRGVGKSNLKQAVIALVEKEGLKCSEGNRGMILIRLDGQRELTFLESFLESESDGE